MSAMEDVHGKTAENTCCSRTRRAISCVYCPPKSNTTTPPRSELGFLCSSCSCNLAPLVIRYPPSLPRGLAHCPQAIHRHSEPIADKQHTAWRLSLPTSTPCVASVIAHRQPTAWPRCSCISNTVIPSETGEYSLRRSVPLNAPARAVEESLLDLRSPCPFSASGAIFYLLSLPHYFVTSLLHNK